MRTEINSGTPINTEKAQISADQARKYVVCLDSKREILFLLVPKIRKLYPAREKG
jgi:hypothetical protein